jgi:hypothetical protein
LPPQESLLNIKSTWQSKAHLEKLCKLIFVHWRFLEDISILLSNPDPNTEISCAAYQGFPLYCQYLGGIGVILEGQITLAGDGDLGTRFITNVNTNRPSKVTSAWNRLVTGNEPDIIPYEVVLCDWAPIAITADFHYLQSQHQTEDQLNAIICSVVNLAANNNLPFTLSND